MRTFPKISKTSAKFSTHISTIFPCAVKQVGGRRFKLQLQQIMNRASSAKRLSEGRHCERERRRDRARGKEGVTRAVSRFPSTLSLTLSFCSRQVSAEAKKSSIYVALCYAVPPLPPSSFLLLLLLRRRLLLPHVAAFFMFCSFISFFAFSCHLLTRHCLAHTHTQLQIQLHMYLDTFVYLPDVMLGCSSLSRRSEV